MIPEPQFFHDVFHASPMGIAVETLEGQPVYANPALCSMLGLSEEEMCMKHCVDFSPLEDAEKDWMLFQKLRTGSIDHYQLEKRYFRRDGSLVWGRVSISLLQGRPSPLVIAMLEDITDKKALQEREHDVVELLKIFVKNVPAGVAMLDRDMRYLQVSDRWCTDYNVDGSQILGRSHYDVFPDIPPRWKEVHRRGLAGETLRSDEDRWDREGGTKWCRWEVRPWHRATGEVGGILIFVEDITARKHMHEALSEVSRKLIQAQEQERTRIGSELHDDINQRLSLLAIEVERLQSDIADPAVRRHMAKLHGQIGSISTAVESLSRQLHPPNLRYLGIAPAMNTFCRDVAEQHVVEIDFKAGRVIHPVSQTVALCLFRVLQEAVHNAVRHSGARHVDVRLECSADELTLTVSDQGKGFDVEAANSTMRLGLISMRERIRLINGKIAIRSALHAGTTVEVSIPLNAGDLAPGEYVADLVKE